MSADATAGAPLQRRRSPVLGIIAVVIAVESASVLVAPNPITNLLLGLAGSTESGQLLADRRTGVGGRSRRWGRRLLVRRCGARTPRRRRSNRRSVHLGQDGGSRDLQGLGHDGLVLQ
jgi:hypothetical protein